MRSKIVILVLAVLLGVLAAVFAGRYLDSVRTEISAQAQPVRVLVATRDIPVGTTAAQILSQGYSGEQQYPRQYVADGAISSPTSIEGLVLAAPLTRGEQLTSLRFKVAEEVGLAYTIPEGFVAVSVPDDPSRGVSGFVTPGDYVMVIASFAPDGGLKSAITKTLISKARVLAAGADTSQTAPAADAQQTGGGGLLSGGKTSAGGRTSMQTLTLAVTLDDAERLVFAQESGSVWYALLGSSSTNVPSTAGEQYPRVLR
jgi:pilus assembly protein CpaB